eukprot:COSAG06_NODE_156_length_21863_cov_29.245405_6_plen_323_part_00
MRPFLPVSVWLCAACTPPSASSEAGQNSSADDQQWSPLRGLPVLPKPHHTWLSWAPLFEDPRSALTRDVVRITRSCPLYACFGGRHSCHSPAASGRPCANDTAGRAAVEACVELAQRGNATIAINFSPWYCVYDSDDPADRSPHAVQQATAELELWRGNLGKVKLWLQDRVQVSALLLDSERFECSRPVPEGCANETLLAAIDEKHNSIYDLAKEIFPSAAVEFFARGEVSFHGISTGGFVHKTMFSLRERGDTLATSLYHIADLGYIRESFQRTVAVAKAHNISAVTPYISLGAGHADAFTGGEYTDNLEYPLLNSWMLGR